MWHNRIQYMGTHRHTHQQIQKRGVKMKAWNARDQTKETLEELLTRKYKEIDGNYKMLKKVQTSKTQKS